MSVVIGSFRVRRRCTQHFEYNCHDDKCLRIELFKLSHPGWTGIKPTPNAPAVTWASSWRKEVELKQLERDRAAQRFAIMQELGMGQLVPVAPIMVPLADYVSSVEGRIPTQVVREPATAAA